jgi:hypothetical protein
MFAQEVRPRNKGNGEQFFATALTAEQFSAIAVSRHRGAGSLPLLARNGHADPIERCPLLGGGLNRSPQHFILEGKDGVWNGTEIS